MIEINVPKLGLEMHTRGFRGPAQHDQCCRNSQAIDDVEAGIGGCTPQQAVDLAHTEIRIQISILRKDFDCFANFIIYM